MRIIKVLLGLALVAMFTLVGVSTASAASVTPVTGVGNPSCAGGLKIEPVADGTYGDITIDVTGSTFSFTTNGFLVTSVVVKGGPGYNLYSYPAPGVESDSGLHSPVAKNGGFYGLSHLCFFGSKKTDPDPK